jgi:uncharacterized membrane protein
MANADGRDLTGQEDSFQALRTCSTMTGMQRILIGIGAVILIVGLLWPWLSRLGLGRLPGDIRIQTESGFFYFPITTCVVISIVLSVVIWFIRR